MQTVWSDVAAQGPIESQRLLPRLLKEQAKLTAIHIAEKGGTLVQHNMIERQIERPHRQDGGRPARVHQAPGRLAYQGTVVDVRLISRLDTARHGLKRVGAAPRLQKACLEFLFGKTDQFALANPLQLVADAPIGTRSLWIGKGSVDVGTTKREEGKARGPTWAIAGNAIEPCTKMAKIVALPNASLHDRVMAGAPEQRHWPVAAEHQPWKVPGAPCCLRFGRSKSPSSSTGNQA